MAISTYAELQAAVGNWLDRSDLALRIPEFIALAEAKFNRQVRAPDMLERDDEFTVNAQYVDLPDGFLEARRFTILTTPVRPLSYLTPQAMSDKRVSLTASQKPGYFSVIGGSFEFLPSPDSSYTASLLYYKKIPALSGEVTSNWLLASHPDIYLFGALLEAAPYLKDDERTPLWSARLSTALDQLGVMSQNKALGGTPVARARGFG